jgi:methionyl-tRNA formyltransferase
MIYVFTNDSYGKQFLEAADRLHDKLEITVVCSAKGERRKGQAQDFFRLPALLWRRWKTRRHFAREFHLRLEIVEDINDPSFYTLVQPNDNGIVAGFNQIFRPVTIRRFRSLVNFHPSLLPLYRGPVPSYWCLKNGEATTGFTVHIVSQQIDAGEILFQQEVAIEAGDDPWTLDQRIAKHASTVFTSYLNHLREGTELPRSRVDALSIYKTHVDYASFPHEQQG